MPDISWCTQYDEMHANNCVNICCSICRSYRFQLFQAALIMKEMDEVVRIGIFIFGHVFYLFLGNYVGQILIDHSTNMFEETYVSSVHRIKNDKSFYIRAKQFCPYCVNTNTKLRVANKIKSNLWANFLAILRDGTAPLCGRKDYCRL